MEAQERWHSQWHLGNMPGDWALLLSQLYVKRHRSGCWVLVARARIGCYLISSTQPSRGREPIRVSIAPVVSTLPAFSKQGSLI